MDVFLLWHLYELTDGNGIRNEEKFIGVFSSEEKATDAIEQLKGKEGFRDYPVRDYKGTILLEEVGAIYQAADGTWWSA